MKPEYWHHKWETSNTRFHRSDVHPYLAKFHRHLPAGTVFVPLCGKTLDMDWLEKQGRKVVGAELSPIACRSFFEENKRSYDTSMRSGFTVFTGKNISLWCGDFFKLPADALEGVTGVYDRAATIALPPEVRPRYHSRLAELTNRAALLLITIEYPQEQVEGPPFCVPEEEVRELLRGREVKLLERRPELDLVNDHPKFKGIVSRVDECAYACSAA
jgi:thiopurine S-methyltransferase